VSALSVSATRVTKDTPAGTWLVAARPATLPAAAMPVIVGAAAALGEGASFRPAVFAATIACALLIQIGTNFANDYSDFHRGADVGRVGPVRVTQAGLLSPEIVRRGIIVAFGLAVLLGAGLAVVGGWPIIVIGLLSLLSGLAYTGGPRPFGYHGLGDLFVFVFFGLVAVTGTAYLQMGEWSAFALVLGVPTGLLVTNILVVNNLRDIDTDRAAAKRTLAVRIGDRATRTQYLIFAAAAYLFPGALAAADPSRRLLLLPLLSLPLAIILVRQVMSGVRGADLNPILGRTAGFLLVFGVLLALGAALSRV
jgi:1,4-dihydroxy-2-naphthoate octaprenyltransferase